LVHEYRDRIYIRKDVLLKLYEYGELNQSKLMSYCGLNNVKHREIIEEMVRKEIILRTEEAWGNKIIIKYRASEKPFHFNEDRGFAEGFDDPPHIPPQVALARIIPILVSLVWLGIGIRQWFVLSKWSKKYERYKELQKRIDAKLDYCNNHVEDKGEGQ
jgi:predicted transcriptional regulator